MWNFEHLKQRERERRGVQIRLLLVAVMICSVLALGGCRLSERLQEMKGGGSAVPPVDLPDLVDDAGVLVPQESTRVTLYFKDKEGQYLVQEQQDVPRVTGIGRAAMEALCRGPVGKDLQPSLPEGAQVRDINVKPDGTCVVDLNQAAEKVPGQDPKAEALAVTAVVNTLTEFPTIQKVQILVDGQVKQTFAGHFPVDIPLHRNLTFVKT